MAAHLPTGPLKTRSGLVVTLLEVSEREREEGIVAVHLPIAL